MNRQAPASTSGSSAPFKPESGTFLLLVFIVLSLSIIGLGWIFYLRQENAIRFEKQAELTAIADMKADQIIAWRTERITDAEAIKNDPFVSSLLETNIRSIKEIASKDALRKWLSALVSTEHYRSVTLFDDHGQKILSYPDATGIRIEPEMRPLFDSAIYKHQVMLSDLHKDGTGQNDIHCELIVPVFPHKGKDTSSLGALGLDIDPKQFLFPLIQSWPMPSKTGEVLLVRKDGNDVVYLNELRHRKNTALALRLPLGDSALPAARAVSGFAGAMEGKDYRSVPVLAVGRAIAGSPWFMIAKVDKTEAFAGTRRAIRVAVGLVTFLILIAGLLIAVFQRHQSSRSYRRLFLAEREKSDLAESLAAEKERLLVTLAERKLAEQALKESEEKFRRIYEQSMLGMALSDRQSRFISVNPAFCDMLGYTKEELEKLTFKDITHPGHLQDDATAVEQLMRGKIPVYKTEKRYITKSGGTLYGSLTLSSLRDDRDQHQFSMVILENITEKKLVADALAAEKERLLVTLRSIGDAVIATDVSSRIVLMNKVAEELTGYSFADSQGRQLSEVFHIINENTRQRCENPVEKVLESGLIVGLANHTALISKDGAEHAIADSGAPIRDNNGVIIGVVLVFRDITEKLRSEAALQNAEKLESIGILAGGIAHDFNNLLSGLFGYLDLAHESVKNDSVASDYLEKAFSVFGRAKDLTSQLLTFSKGGAPAKKTHSLSPLIRNAVHFALSGSQVKPHYEIEGDLWHCDVDENQIGQALDNIVINARDAMPMGGAITVSAENIPAGSPLPAVLSPGNYVRISIADQGTGIAPEHLPRIFDPFFTTKQKGSGLGLATSYSIVKRHEGIIEAESELGKGSMFFIYLPSSNNSAALEQKAETDATHTGSGRVLVMDDEDFILDVAAAMLTGMGYTVDTATHGREAIEKFNNARADGSPFSLVILDLTIPGGMGGKQTKDELRKIAPSAKIMASSGYSDDPIMSHPRENGFDESVRKPYDKSELAKAVGKVMKEERS